MKESQARPETLLPATLVCTSKPTGDKNDGRYEVTIPLIYLIEAMKRPAAFYKFLFIGLKYDTEYDTKRKTIHKRKSRGGRCKVS
jgi:hypothetical protein